MILMGGPTRPSLQPSMQAVPASVLHPRDYSACFVSFLSGKAPLHHGWVTSVPMVSNLMDSTPGLGQVQVYHAP